MYTTHVLFGASDVLVGSCDSWAALYDVFSGHLLEVESAEIRPEDHSDMKERKVASRTELGVECYQCPWILDIPNLGYAGTTHPIPAKPQPRKSPKLSPSYLDQSSQQQALHLYLHLRLALTWQSF